MYSRLRNNPSDLIINPCGWAEGPRARARAQKLTQGPDPGPGAQGNLWARKAHRAQWAPGPGSGPNADLWARARASGPSAQPEGLIIKPRGLLSNFEQTIIKHSLPDPEVEGNFQGSCSFP